MGLVAEALPADVVVMDSDAMEAAEVKPASLEAMEAAKEETEGARVEAVMVGRVRRM